MLCLELRRVRGRRMRRRCGRLCGRCGRRTRPESAWWWRQTAGSSPAAPVRNDNSEMRMATVGRTTKVKIATSRANGAREMGHLQFVKAPSGARAGAPAPHEPGRFGVYGGRYVPETLMAALEELERAYE